MADDYEFEDSQQEREPHPLDSADFVKGLRFNKLTRQIFENLENRPKPAMAKFPAWVYEALADMMVYFVMRESYKNRSPENIEEFYGRQGAIRAYENLGQFFSQEAAKLKDATETTGGQ